MTEITGGEALARCLGREGIRFVFGLPCPEIDPLLAALEANGIRLVPVRHEAAGAYMAAGLYKTTGQVAAVLGNPGPGSANLLAGVITARHEGVPLVAITSQHRLGIVYPSPPTTFQGQDQLAVYAPSVKWGGPIFEYDRIARDLEERGAELLEPTPRRLVSLYLEKYRTKRFSREELDREWIFDTRPGGAIRIRNRCNRGVDSPCCFGLAGGFLFSYARDLRPLAAIPLDAIFAFAP